MLFDLADENKMRETTIDVTSMFNKKFVSKKDKSKPYSALKNDKSNSSLIA
jgi:hypothetical protein